MMTHVHASVLWRSDYSIRVPENSENKPRGLYFSKALFEGLIFGGAYIRRGLSTEGNLRFKIDWASLIVGRKFTLFPLFYFVFEGNFQVQAGGVLGLYLERRFHGGFFLRYEFGGAYIWRAYTWRGLFSEFSGIFLTTDYRVFFKHRFVCNSEKSAPVTKDDWRKECVQPCRRI